MKLSEAILLGSVGTEQAHSYAAGKGKACALEAAVIAIGKPKSEWERVGVTYWDWTNVKSPCPHKNWYGQCKEHDTIGDIIWHLNDNHEWTRPQIAAWVASVEPQEEVKEESCQNENLKKMPQTVQS